MVKHVRAKRKISVFVYPAKAWVEVYLEGQGVAVDYNNPSRMFERDHLDHWVPLGSVPDPEVFIPRRSKPVLNLRILADNGKTVGERPFSVNYLVPEGDPLGENIHSLATNSRGDVYQFQVKNEVVKPVLVEIPKKELSLSPPESVRKFSSNLARKKNTAHRMG